MLQDSRSRAGVAGIVAVAVALGVGELLAGVFRQVPSPLASVGGYVVDYSPPFVKDFAIDVFGTADKTALAIGTTLIALLIGWQVGVRSARRGLVGVAAFAIFGLIGVAAGLGEPFASPIQLVAATAVAATAGWLSLDWLGRVAGHQEEPTDGLAGDTDRRRFIWMAAGGSAVAAVAGFGGRRLLSRVPEVPAISVLGPEADEPSDGAAFGVAGLTPLVVPNEQFYRIDTALVVPLVDERDWSLRVHGDVEREVRLSYDDLLAMEIEDRHVTIACVSNEVGGGLVGNALWSGVRLSTILEEAGANRTDTQLVGRSVDGFTAGFPTELAFDGREPLVALGMNGEPLPRRHGFPVRLIVPGLYGYVSATKWLSEIEITGWDDFDGYWIPRGWAKEAPIKTQSRIDVPRDGQDVEPGLTTVAGVAWAPGRGVERVEVQLDDGEWAEAELSESLSAAAWRQWRLPVDLASGSHVLRVRATDGSGSTQTAERRPPRPDGATGYHTITIQVA